MPKRTSAQKGETSDGIFSDTVANRIVDAVSNILDLAVGVPYADAVAKCISDAVFDAVSNSSVASTIGKRIVDAISNGVAVSSSAAAYSNVTVTVPLPMLQPISTIPLQVPLPMPQPTRMKPS